MSSTMIARLADHAKHALWRPSRWLGRWFDTTNTTELQMVQYVPANTITQVVEANFWTPNWRGANAAVREACLKRYLEIHQDDPDRVHQHVVRQLSNFRLSNKRMLAVMNFRDTTLTEAEARQSRRHLRVVDDTG